MKKSSVALAAAILVVCIILAVPSDGFQNINGKVQGYITWIIWGGFSIIFGIVLFRDKIKNLAEAEDITDFVEQSE